MVGGGITEGGEGGWRDGDGELGSFFGAEGAGYPRWVAGVVVDVGGGFLELG